LTPSVSFETLARAGEVGDFAAFTMSSKPVKSAHSARSVGVGRIAVQALLVGVVYYAGAEIGFRMKFPSIPTSMFWLPNATMFAVFLLAPVSRWWVYALAVLPAHIAVQVPNQMPASTIALLFVSNLTDGALGALALRYFSRGRPLFGGFLQVALFLLFAVLTPFLVSFADAATMVWTGRAQDYWLVWHTRFRSNVLTNLIWVPAVVTAVTRGPAWFKAASPRRLGEAALLAIGLALIGFSVFGPFGSRTVTAVLLAPFPLFFWGAVRFGAGGVSAALLGFAFPVIWHAAQGNGPLIASSPADNTPAVQLFLTLLAAPMLLLASLLQEKRQVASTLAERESQYRSIFESTGDGVLITDLANEVAAVNPAFCVMTGYTAEELARTNPREFLHLDELQPFDSYLARANTNDPVVAEVMCVSRDGRLSRLELSGKRFSYGGQVHVLSVVRDVTERERSLRLLEEKVVERTRELSMMLEISNIVASNLELKSLLHVVLQQLQSVLQCTGATILIVKGDELVILDHRGPLGTDAITKARVARDWAIEYAKLRRGSPLIIDNIWGASAPAKAFRDSAPAALTSLLMHARSLLLVPLEVRGRPIGLLLIDSDQPGRYGTREAQLAWALANQAAVAIENATLYDQARELATLEERQRLARDLHDSVTQTLYTASMLGRALPRAWDSDPGQGQAMLAHLGEVTESALAEMRTLLLELRPSAVVQSQLPDLLRQLAQAVRSHVENPIQLDLQAAGTLPMEVHLTFYRLARAALGNVAKHAASSQARVVLRQRADVASIVISDDGAGFDPARVAQHPRMGLDIMRERAAAVGAILEIESEIGKGTKVSLSWTARSDT
jgi:PAS domain S-box-containing protein